MVKFIVVVGGVISGVGKGVTTASIGRILKEYGYKVTSVKIDPYINYDAGTLRPTEHGEVWVTDDGGEIDQDLGNYERFLNIDISRRNNITTGQIYGNVIEKERAGKYLGETVQFIPHIPNEIKERINKSAKGYDFCLIEVGGTIGDYENIPYLFALKSLEREIGKENIVYVMITYLPVPSHIEEMKTKPTQQAIRLLTEHGIIPDFIICRAKTALDSVRKKKIEIYANIRSDHVISEPDIDTIYRIPLDLEKEKLGLKILEEFCMKPKKKPKWRKWKNLVENIVRCRKEIKVAMVGKYVDIGDYSLADSYISINQALQHAGANLNVKIKIEWIDAKKFERSEKKLKELKNYDGIIVPGGFGGSGVEGKIKAVRFARENNVPYLGLCYGMQMAVIEFARNVCGMKDANTSEVNSRTKHPVIDILPQQKKLMEESRYGGTMRLGAYTAMLKENSKILGLYRRIGRVEEDRKRILRLMGNKKELFRLGTLEKGKTKVLERHRHRYEVNPDFISELEEKGLVFSGYHIRNDQEKLMEFIELPKHKFFCATQGHPEFKSSLTDPAPLFYGFVRACVK
ncbi:MAG: CTP synthase (glutamine hydrolyzing) [Nanoarchaeota archaeon]|nr:CTP synthase (glutamine hydrolyzing) [Nanoarchaeota archaeon]